jgi:surface polysaccharide O-acyltransferase-like enzyme
VAIWLTMGETRPFSFEWWLGCWLFWVGHAAIPIFVMISGALLLDDKRRESAAAFYRRRLLRVGIPLVWWTVVYLFVRRFVDGEVLSAARVVELLLTGDPYYHLWFLYMIFGLYLLTPALRAFVRGATRGQRRFFIVLGLVLANAYFQADVLLWDNQRTIFTMFIPYIAFYLLGYEIRGIDPGRIRSRWLIVGVVVSALYIAAFAGVFVDRQGGVGVRFVFDFFSPPLVFLAVGIFWAAYLHERRARPLVGVRKTAVEWVASTTLGVYVLHPLMLEILRRELSDEAGDGTFLLGLIVVPLITFVACYFATALIMNIPLVRRTVC